MMLNLSGDKRKNIFYKNDLMKYIFNTYQLVLSIQKSSKMSKIVSKKVNLAARQVNTQLVEPFEYNPANIIFDDPVAESIPGQPGTNYRVNIGYKNKDKSEGNFILEFDACYCFGVSENQDKATNTLNGYILPISLFDMNGPTPKQQKVVEVLCDIVSQCKKQLLNDDTQEKMGKYDDNDKIIESDLRKVDLIYWKKENGKPMKEKGGTFYPKLLWNKSREKNGKFIESKINTRFYNENEVDADGNPVEVDPLNYVGKKCMVTAAVKIESIFIGTKIGIQAKVYEAFIREVESGPKRLLVYKPKTNDSISMEREPEVVNEASHDDIDDLINEEQKEEEKKPAPTVVAGKEEKKKKITKK